MEEITFRALHHWMWNVVFSLTSSYPVRKTEVYVDNVVFTYLLAHLLGMWNWKKEMIKQLDEAKHGSWTRGQESDSFSSFIPHLSPQKWLWRDIFSKSMYEFSRWGHEGHLKGEGRADWT